MSVLKLRAREGELPNWNDYSGLIISDKEIDDLLAHDITDSTFFRCPEYLQERIHKLEEDIKMKIDGSLKMGINLSLIQISKRLGLTKFETRVILICLAPELNSKYERIYAYLHNDVTKKRPSMGLIFDILCSSIEEKISFRRFFLQSSNLFRFRILQYDNSKDGRFFWHILSTSILIDEHVTNLILQNNVIDWRLEPFIELINLEENGDEKNMSFEFVYQDLKKQIITTIKRKSFQNQQEIMDLNSEKIVFHFIALDDMVKKTLAKEVCREFELPLLIADVYKVESYYAEDFEVVIELLFREALLKNAILFIDNFDSVLKNRFSNNSEVENTNNGDNNKSSKNNNLKFEILLRNIKFTPQKIIILSGGKSELILDEFESYVYPITIKFPEFSHIDRKKIWSKSLNDYNIIDTVDIDDLSTKFRFTERQIKNALLDANNSALLRNEQEKNNNILRITSSDLYEACRFQSNRRISFLARRTDMKFTLDDIVLPIDKKRQLFEIINHVKYKNDVFYGWGFEEKLLLGKGLNIMFAGESGTGKTMAAGIIAHELKLELYKIDLSSIVSKYVGETEKNINKIFNEAETSNAILCFDEADAIFGKRSDVKDAQDRYANIEINFLLQKLEEHKEIVILTSNLAKNIDDAFLRRMHFWIEFSPPDVESRFKIWKNMFPDKAPLDTNTVDFNFLAKQFQITGGIIKNIVISSAFLAKELGSIKISMEHIIKALKREFDKMGKPCLKTEFGKYYEIITETE
jgi:SpoVK/Ycf46/Vps4 family AAA+-type ATPase